MDISLDKLASWLNNLVVDAMQYSSCIRNKQT